MKYNIEFISKLEEELEKSNYEKNNEIFNSFITFYDNLKKTYNIPIFNNSTKFCNKNKKLYKNKNNTQCIFIRNKNAWVPNASNDIDKEIKNSIISNLNKISSNNFDKISDILIKDLHKATNKDIINILCDELINKNIYDKDYQDEYVKLCIRICDIDINKDNLTFKFNNKYYFKNIENYIGPFDNEKDAYEYNKNNLYFKKILLNKLFDKFMERHHIYDKIISLEDIEIKYKKKREILSILEFICKLFNKGVIDYNIIYLIHLSLLNINCKLDYININIEILYNMWDILKNVSNKKFNINHINSIFSLFHNNITKLKTNYRIEFFIECIIDNIKDKFKHNLKEPITKDNSLMYKKFDNDNESNDNESNDNESNDNESNEIYYIEDKIINLLKNNNIYSHIVDIENIEEYLDTLIYIVLNNMSFKQKCIDCLEKLLENNKIDNDLLKKLISHSDEELEEMMLDNNNVKNNFIILKNDIYDLIV